MSILLGFIIGLPVGAFVLRYWQVRASLRAMAQSSASFAEAYEEAGKDGSS